MAPEQSTNNKEPLQRGAQTTQTVIVVDDDPAMLDSTCQVLDQMGYAALPFAEVVDVPEAASEAKPVAILLDLRMPNANVPGLVAALRSAPSTSSIPIVFFSANPDVAHTASRYGAWGFLEKPFTSAQLSQLIERAAAYRFGPAPVPNANAKRDARTSFHDYWNTLGALSNYAYLMRADPKLDEAEQAMAKNMEDLVLRLQSQTERLQKYVLSMFG